MKMMHMNKMALLTTVGVLKGQLGFPLIQNLILIIYI